MSEAARQLAQATLSKSASERRRRKLATLQLLRGGAAVCFFLCVMLLIAMLHLNRLPIKEIVFEGNTHYSRAELQDIIPQKIGDALHLVNKEELRGEMLSACPYLSDVSVEVSLRGVVRITVSERTPLWALRYDVDADTVGYVLLDQSLLALEYTPESQDCCVVICPGIALPQIGETLAAAGKRLELAYVAERIEAGEDEDEIEVPPYVLSAQRLDERLLCIARGCAGLQEGDGPAAVDFSSAYDYTLTMKDGSVLLLGNAEMLETQISYALSAMQDYRQDGGTIGPGGALMVDVRDISRVFVREISP